MTTARTIGTALLLTTTALSGAAFAKPCPPSSAGGNNTACNAVSTPTPFTVTLNLDVAEQVAVPVDQENPNPGSKRRDIGFLQDSWLRFNIDGVEGDWHYGFVFNLLVTSSPFSNSVSTTINSTDREAFFVRHPKWGKFTIGDGQGTAWTGLFPMTLGPGSDGWGPPGSAPANIGPDNGLETQFLVDPGAQLIDGTISAVGGADLLRPTGEYRIHWVSPNWYGSDDDHGIHLDMEYDLSGKGHDESFFRINSTGPAAQAAGPGANAPDVLSSLVAKNAKQKNFQFTNLQQFDNLITTAVGWEDLVAKDVDLILAGLYSHGTAQHGDPTTPGGGGLTHDPTRKLYKDVNEFNSGISAIIGNCDESCVTTGFDYSFSGRSAYANGLTDNLRTGATHKAFKTMASQGFSVGVQWDFDRYTLGGYYQFAVGQGDFQDPGYIQLQYYAVGGAIKIFKGLKAFNEILVYNDRYNHSAQSLAAQGLDKRNINGGAYIMGVSLDF